MAPRRTVSRQCRYDTDPVRAGTGGAPVEYRPRAAAKLIGAAPRAHARETVDLVSRTSAVPTRAPTGAPTGEAVGRPAAQLRTTRRLLQCGAAAGPILVAVTGAQVLTRRGFDLRRHGISLLSLGDRGWIQVVNFVLAGVLSVAFGQGVRRVLAGRQRLAPMVISGYGVGLIATGTFLVDPGDGFPAGTPAGVSAPLSWHGAVHAAAPPAAFACLVGTCFLFARRYAALGRRGWAAHSAATGALAAGLIFWPGSAGSIRSALAVLLTSTWTTAVAAQLLSEQHAA